ncbi:hypothetical protein [Paenibacillus senegalensis]|uniref:hypothetical protein n=1 Tax=Paenibacillus senegalensis TaxID=1465766 RepID=UPI00028A06EE|nr:hypothetical protein [Paenibacillus senegalensis]
MTIEQALATYIGRTIEIHQITQYQEGHLVGVEEGLLNVLSEDVTYGAPPVSMTFLLQNVGFIRVIQ